MWEIQKIFTLLFAVMFLNFPCLSYEIKLWNKDVEDVNLLQTSCFLEEESGNRQLEDQNNEDRNEAASKNLPLIRKGDASEYWLTYQPFQTETLLAAFEFKGSEIKPVANYAIRARVLKSEIDFISPLGMIAPVRHGSDGGKWEVPAIAKIFSLMRFPKGFTTATSGRN